MKQWDIVSLAQQIQKLKKNNALAAEALVVYFMEILHASHVTKQEGGIRWGCPLWIQIEQAKVVLLGNLIRENHAKFEELFALQTQEKDIRKLAETLYSDFIEVSIEPQLKENLKELATTNLYTSIELIAFGIKESPFSQHLEQCYVEAFTEAEANFFQRQRDAKELARQERIQGFVDANFEKYKNVFKALS